MHRSDDIATRRSRRALRRGGVLAVTVLLAVFASAAGVASASSSGVRGRPQPEAKPFRIGTPISGGQVAVEPGGDLVAVFDVQRGSAETTEVCVLKRGARQCSTTTRLSPLDGDSDFGIPQVYAESDTRITVLQGACCDTDANGGDLLWHSSNGGKTFGVPTRVGDQGVQESEVIGSQVLWSDDDASSLQVSAVPLDASGPAPAPATVRTGDAFGIGLGVHKGAAIVASTEPTSSSSKVTTAVAPAGSDLDESVSYTSAGDFDHEQFDSASGAALLTTQTNKPGDVLLRTYGSSGWGVPHIVPGSAGVGTLSNWFVDQDPSGRIHVFTDSAAADYNLTEVSTGNGGRSWTKPATLYNAEDGGIGSANLDSDGSGIVLGTGDSKTIAYPILQPVTVTLRLSASRVKAGHKVRIRGQAAPSVTSALVSLQSEHHATWTTIAKTHESHSGRFSFTIKGAKAETLTLRAVTADRAGYVEYGYSPSRKLIVVKKH